MGAQDRCDQHDRCAQLSHDRDGPAVAEPPCPRLVEPDDLRSGGGCLARERRAEIGLRHDREVLDRTLGRRRRAGRRQDVVVRIDQADDAPIGEIRHGLTRYG